MRCAMKLRTSATLITGLSVLALVACDRDKDRPAPEQRPAVTAPGASVDAIKEAPGHYFGKTVHVSGEVDQIFSDRAFELEGSGWAFDDNIIVLTKAPVRVVGAPLASGDDVIVTGTVRPFTVAEVERDLGWDLGTDLEVKLSKRPVLVASSISKVTEYGRWSGTSEADPIVNTLTVAMGDPAMLAGRKVDLERERVQAVMGKGLWVGPTHMSQVFVLPASDLKDVQPGDWVRVTGTLQKAPKDAAKSWELPANMAGVVGEESLFVDGATVTEVAQRPKGARR
jgi:hypothetical protein